MTQNETVKEPLPHSGEEERYTKADAEEDPVRKEAKKTDRVSEVAERRLREERILDLPIPVRVGKTSYQYTSRPMGFVKLALNEFLGISSVISDIQEGMNAMIEGDAAGKEVSAEDVRKLLMEKGEEATQSIFKVVQLLLEPVTGGPPDLANPHVPLEAIEWEMEVSEIAFLLTKFIERDISALGGAVKNLIGFNQQN